MRVHDQQPDESELLAYTDRLNEITSSGGTIEYVQVYTIARKPAQIYVTALKDDEVDHIVNLIHQHTDLRGEPYYGTSEY